jgi:hypothetical protein
MLQIKSRALAPEGMMDRNNDLIRGSLEANSNKSRGHPGCERHPVTYAGLPAGTKETFMLTRMEETFMLKKVAICFALLISLFVPVAAQLPSTPYSPSLLLGAAW